MNWTVINDIDTAAALRSFGVKVMSDKGQETRNGKAWARWSACNDGFVAGTEVPAGTLVRAVSGGDLSGVDPAHPILDALGVLKIRHQLVDALKNGAHYRISITESVYGSVLHRGDEPPRIQIADSLRTGDLKLAACLVRLGLPLQRIEGTPPNSLLVLAATGYELHGTPPVLAAEMVPQFRALPRQMWATPAPDMPPPETHPQVARICALMHALWVRDRLHDYINGRIQNLIIESPFNQRQVIMPENADGRTLDKCRKFLHIP